MNSAALRAALFYCLGRWFVSQFPAPLYGQGSIPARRAFTTDIAASRGLRAAGAARKGGTPGEGSPFTPSCAL